MHTWDTVIGHEKEIRNIKNSIASGKVSHAYIINSDDLISREMIKDTFVKTLMCEEKGAEPCNKCNACLTFEHKNNPDVIEVDSEDKKSIGVEQIREKVVLDINIKPYKSRYKIYIIEDADTMTEMAQNAILKTIEEPHEYAIIIMMATDYKKFLPTILSRCTVVNLEPIDIRIINKYIGDKYSNKKENVDIYSAYSEGNLSKLENIINSKEFDEFRNELVDLTKQIAKPDIDNIMKAKKYFEENEKKTEEILKMLYIWYRDLSIVKNDAGKEYIINKDKLEELKDQASELTYTLINKIIENIEYITKNLKSNINIKLAINVMMLDVREN